MALNTPKEQITAHLMAAGWQKEEIKEAFHEASKTAGFPGGAITFSDLEPRRHRVLVRIGRGFVIILLCIVIAFTVFSILFNFGFVGPQK